MKRFIAAGARTLPGAAACLLAALMLFIPLGVATHQFLPDAALCGVSCPCKATPPADHYCHPVGAAAPAEAPVSGQCPGGCPECNCCPGLVLGLFPVSLPPLPLPVASAAPRSVPEVSVRGHLADVFRPPRTHA